MLRFKDSGIDLFDELGKRGLAADRDAYARLYSLYGAIRERPTLQSYLEEDQDPDKVLDIFVRVNSGGMTLSYSDLLLSMATNQWKDLDAREEVRTLVSELNSGATEFNFNKDNVLKAGLMLTDVPDLGFKISNFTQKNMSEMERKWPEIRKALQLATRLLGSFGFTTRTLSANSVIHPVAYYIYKHQLGDSYLTAGAHTSDREKLRLWVTRSLVKRNIWGTGLDSLLARLRDVLRSSPSDEGFPTSGLEAAMATLGRPLQFGPEEIAELLDLQYSAPRTFPVLALLYPGLDLSQQFHEDHIFPKSRFTKARLVKEGVPEGQVGGYISRVNGLANLQLLAGARNVEKQSTWPWEWVAASFHSEQARDQYVVSNDLDLLPARIDGFLAFADKRRSRLEARLRQLLGVPIEAVTVAPELKPVVRRPNNPNWTREEVILALKAYVQAGVLHGGPLPGERSSLVLSLSADLQSLDIHPDEGRQDGFRNPAGVLQKLGNLRAAERTVRLERGEVGADQLPQGLANNAQVDRDVFEAYGDTGLSHLEDAALRILSIRRQAPGSNDSE